MKEVIFQKRAARNQDNVSLFLDSGHTTREEELENLSQVDVLSQARTQRTFSEAVGQDFDLLDDIDRHKDIYRLKVTQYDWVL